MTHTFSAKPTFFTQLTVDPAKVSLCRQAHPRKRTGEPGPGLDDTLRDGRRRVRTSGPAAGLWRLSSHGVRTGRVGA